MDSLEKQLVCPICLEMFQKPVVILPCQHNLCRKCANDVFQASNPYLSTRMSGSVSSGGRFRCPSCRHEVVLDRHGVYGLQRNLLVENIIDMYKQGSASKPTADPPQPEVLMCEEHPDEKINIYCVSCSAPTCSMCKVFGAHKDCEVAPLHTVFSAHKAELTDCISLLVGNNERTQAIISHLEETCRAVDESGQRQKSHVCEVFDRLFSLLEQKKLSLTQRITVEQEEKLDYIRGLRSRYTEHLERSTGTLQGALQTLEQADHALFLQVTVGTNTSHLDKLQRGYENMDHFTTNFELQKRALSNIAFNRYDEDSDEEYEEAELRATTGSRSETLPVAAAGPSTSTPAPPTASPMPPARSPPPTASPHPPLAPPMSPSLAPSLSPSLPPPLLPAVPPVSFPPLPSQRAAEATPTPTWSHAPSTAPTASGSTPSEQSDADEPRHVFSFSWLNKE
ncbi:hypothetical protein NQD34_013183 [Periophthalmus magnuspinnatus]|nr:hypothetical protein NQD34_013183 [Periophthalmus magnuspinnatus]